MKLTKISLAAIGLLLSSAAPAHANETFDFTFTAPLTNGDTASGFGKLVTADLDGAGHYRFLKASGSLYAYVGQDPAGKIAWVAGLDNAFNWTDGFLYKDATDNFVTDGLFFGLDGPGGIGLWTGSAGLYDGFYTEVGVRDASLSFAPGTAASVPEPATWAMMLGGFALAGATLRRGAAKAAFAA